MYKYCYSNLGAIYAKGLCLRQNSFIIDFSVIHCNSISATLRESRCPQRDGPRVGEVIRGHVVTGRIKIKVKWCANLARSMFYSSITQGLYGEPVK